MQNMQMIVEYERLDGRESWIYKVIRNDNSGDYLEVFNATTEYSWIIFAVCAMRNSGSLYSQLFFFFFGSRKYKSNETLNGKCLIERLSTMVRSFWATKFTVTKSSDLINKLFKYVCVQLYWPWWVHIAHTHNDGMEWNIAKVQEHINNNRLLILSTNNTLEYKIETKIRKRKKKIIWNSKMTQSIGIIIPQLRFKLEINFHRNSKIHFHCRTHFPWEIIIKTPTWDSSCRNIFALTEKSIQVDAVYGHGVCCGPIKPTVKTHFALLVYTESAFPSSAKNAKKSSVYCVDIHTCWQYTWKYWNVSVTKFLIPYALWWVTWDAYFLFSCFFNFFFVIAKYLCKLGLTITQPLTQ